MENKNKPAFACMDSEYIQEGLTKREYFAGQALVGMISNPRIIRPKGVDTLEADHIQFAKVAVLYADYLLEELDKTQ